MGSCKRLQGSGYCGRRAQSSNYSRRETEYLGNIWLRPGVVHGIVIRNQQRNHLVFVHGVHQEHLLEPQHLPALQDLQHGADSIALVLLALLHQNLVGALIVVGTEGIADPCLMTAGMFACLVSHLLNTRTVLEKPFWGTVKVTMIRGRGKNLPRSKI
jgi:hypothetical protein